MDGVAQPDWWHERILTVFSEVKAISALYNDVRSCGWFLFAHHTVCASRSPPAKSGTDEMARMSFLRTLIARPAFLATKVSDLCTRGQGLFLMGGGSVAEYRTEGWS